jgi:hypothetical protein
MKAHACWMLVVIGILAGVAIIGGNEARAVMASPPTCVASEAMCTRCAEYEGPRRRGGSSRCVKCERIPGCTSYVPKRKLPPGGLMR